MARSDDLTIEEALEAALDRIDRPGNFYAAGRVPPELPGLEVKGVGQIALPLPGAQLKALKERAEPAPYGKGTQTLVDTSVRRVWHLTPDRFKLTNPNWTWFLEGIVAKIRAELGLEGQALEAHLYDLLLYEPGGFFLPHRDGEKLDRMVATLVIVLPSKFDGGELIVRHEGREQVIDFSAPESRFQVQYAAFYADCEHEVKPLKSGHRLCLVYNLTLAPKKSVKSESKSKLRLPAKVPGPPRRAERVDEIVKILREWKKESASRNKVAVLLDHQYSQDGLSWDTLKGVDRAKAGILEEAARQTGFLVHLAQLTYWESGAADEEDRYADYGGDWYDEEEEDYDDEGDDEEDEGDENESGDVEGEHRMDEIFDQSLTADHWRSPDGRPAPFGPIPVDEQEVIPPDSLKTVKPKEEYEGYTGNEGMTLERWYRHAAIVLWPESRHLDVLLAAGSKRALGALEQMVSDWRAAKGEEAEHLKARCLRFARRILDAWPTVSAPRSYSSWYDSGPAAGQKDDAADPMTSLQRLDDPKLIGTYIGDVLAKDATLEIGAAVTRAVLRHGWAALRPNLVRFFKASGLETFNRNSEFLEHLCQAAAASGAEKQKAPSGALRDSPRTARTEASAAWDTCRQLAEATVIALIGADGVDRPHYDEDDRAGWRYNAIDRPKMLANLTRAFLTVRLDDPLEKLVDQVLKLPNHYPLRPVQLPALVGLGPWLKKHRKDGASRSPALSRWMVDCRRQLEALTAAEPQPPADWRRGADFKCNCADCKALKAFLRDPHLKAHSFQMPQARRKHLEEQIKKHKLDLTCGTDRRPRPQILVCTKNQSSYNRRLRQYQEDLEDLAGVRKLEKDLGM